jgi:hypothetical protein
VGLVSAQSLTLAAQKPAARWAVLFVPSLSDLFFTAVILWAFAIGAYGWQSLLLDGDVGTHIRIGDYIASHRAVPTHDMLSFSKPGGEWYAFEWLTELVFSLLHTAAGLKGVVLLAGVVIAATYTLLLMHSLWRGANLIVALGLTLIAINSSWIHFHARPHAFTSLFLVAAMWLIAADRKRRSAKLWLLVPITAVWTNLHGGFFLLFALLGLLVIGCLAEHLIWGELGSRGKSDVARYSILGLACAAASLINPYGVKLHLFLQDYLRSDTIRNGVQEFQSPSFRSESMYEFMVLLFAGLALTAPLLRKRRLTEMLWIWFMAYNSLVSVRHAPLYLIVAVPILAGELTAWWDAFAASSARGSIARTLDAVTKQYGGGAIRISLWSVAVVVALAFSQSSNWPKDFVPEGFPVKIVDKHGAELAASRVFTSDKYAGYLLYRNYPKQRVFFDDRHHYFGEEMAGEYRQLLSGGPKWRELLSKYRFDLALIDSETALASLLRADAGWETVEDDGKIAMFRRKVSPPVLASARYF